jgi:lipopolysaccharide biosynthesis glycosyltransferase
MKTIAFFCNVTTEKFLNITTEINTYKEIGLNSNDQSRYKEYLKCAIDSFKKFHPDIEVVCIDDNNIIEYTTLFNSKLINCATAQKFNLGLEVMKYYKADKLIILDVDTITCSRLDEIIDNNEDDILVSLNYNIQDQNEYFTTPYYTLEFEDGTIIKDSANLNSGIICFNNIKAIERALELTIIHPNYFGEQGALNELVWVEGTFKTSVLDGPWPVSTVSYNVRSKGVNFTEHIFEIAKNHPNQSYIAQYYVKDSKLFTPDHKHIKVWHLAEGMHGRPLDKFNELTDIIKTKLFNADTIEFFKEQCGCSEFFS